MSIGVWIESTKPKVYPASIGPVVIGTALAAAEAAVRWELLPLILICAVLIQLVSNWTNDLYDFTRGADAKERAGPRRVLAEGLIKPTHLKTATWLAATVCFLLGMILVNERGWIVLAIGLASLVGAWMYTGGPYSFAYHGLGEVAALFFFGMLGVNGTYYIHTGTISVVSVVMSVSIGMLVANILLVNNIRDVATDASVGKRTLVVLIGAKASRWLYCISTWVSIILPSVFLFTDRGPILLFPLLALIPAVGLMRYVMRNEGKSLNKALVSTGLLLLLFTILTTLALLASTLISLPRGLAGDIFAS
ncbi:MAG: 1,4-dihydroxy-2-naphthoate polyprenyltransferase [Ignavibacteria bacterium]|nr:1,4-dihydroxy-2-naphthoate polyprenyltransferase [Ignavibacteria bacterium]